MFYVEFVEEGNISNFLLSDYSGKKMMEEKNNIGVMEYISLFLI